MGPASGAAVPAGKAPSAPPLCVREDPAWICPGCKWATPWTAGDGVCLGDWIPWVPASPREGTRLPKRATQMAKTSCWSQFQVRMLELVRAVCGFHSAIPAPSQLPQCQHLSEPACPGMGSHRQGMEELLLLLLLPEAQPRTCLAWADESAQEKEKQKQADGRNGAGT